MEYYSAIKKNGIRPFVATWMDLECVILIEVTQSKGEISYDIPHLWNLKINDTNELTYKTERDSQTQKMKSCFLGEGTSKDIGEVVYTLLYFKWITNKNLLYSTQNSAQRYVPVWMGGRYWRRIDICIYLAEESLHCSLETITTLLISHTSIQNRRRQWQPTPVLMPGKSHGWRSLVGCSPWGR